MAGTGRAPARFSPVPNPTIRQRVYSIGCRIADRGANLAGHPLAIIGVIVACTACFLLFGGDVALNLTLALSVLAITLTQMVLNQQKRHEVALHLKIDDLMGIEHKSEVELEALRITGDKAEEVLEKRRTGQATTAAADRLR